jgi:hypothetical protein
MAVLKPPQKKIPEKKPADNKPMSEYFTLGFLSLAHKAAIFDAIKTLQTS